MASTPISSPDRALLRSVQQIDKLGVWITPLVTVQTGVITAIPIFSPFVQISLSWDGSHSAVSVGQLVKIESSGGTLKAWAVVRKAPTAGILYISQTPIGSAGFPTQIENAIAVTDIVTVYTHRPLWGLYSRITGQNFYKQWDVAYTDQNEEPPPVANTGAWQAAFLENGATEASFRLPRIGANSSFAFGAETITAYLWTLPSGVTLQAGYAATDSVIEVDAVAGSHLVSLRVTDSEGKTHTSYLWLFVSDGTTGTALSEDYAVSLSDRNQNREGREIELEITGTNLESVIYPGAGIFLREWATYGAGESLTEGVAIDSFVGYVTEINMEHDGNIGRCRLSVQAPYLYAANIAQPSQSLSEVANPNKWTQMDTVLSNPRGLLYYAIKWHTPSLLDMHDFDAPYTTPRRKECVWSGGSLQDAMRYVADLFLCNIGSASDGTTVLRKNPLYMGQSDRDAIETVMDWLDTDMQAPYEYRKRFAPPLQEATSGAFAFDSTNKAKAWAVRKRWNPGTGKAQLPNFTVTPAEGILRVREVIGHFFAEQNSDILSIDFSLTMNQDVLEPALMLWHSLTVDSDYDAFASGLSSKRLLLDSVSREYNFSPNGIYKTITYASQPETFGQAGEEVPYKKWQNFQLGGFSPYNPVLFQPYAQSGVFGGSNALAAIDDNGKGAITYNYFAISPDWIDLSPYLNNESVNDICIDYASAYFTSGTNVLGMWAVTTSGTTLNIWNFPDILNSLTPTLVHSLTMNDSTVTTEARIEHSETSESLVLVAFKDDTGTSFSRSDDGGATFSSAVHIGDTINDLTVNENAPLGMAVDGERQLIAAPFAALDYRVYIAATMIDSFTELANSESGEAPQPCIKIDPESEIAYTTNLVDGNQTITFDPTRDYIYFAGDSGGIQLSKVPLIYYGVSTTPQTAIEVANGIGDGGGWGYRWFGNDMTFAVVNTLSIQFAVSASYTITNIIFKYRIEPSGSTVVFRAGTGFASNFTGAADGNWHTVDWDADVGATSWTAGSGVNFLQIDPNQAINPAVPFDIRLDSIEIVTTSSFVERMGILWKIEDFEGTDNWTEITPRARQAPEHPHDFAVDIVDNDILNFISDSYGTWYRSENAGTGFNEVSDDTDYRSILTSGNAMLLGATDGVFMVANGTDVEDKTGNLALVWGGIGRIKRIVPLG